MKEEPKCPVCGATRWNLSAIVTLKDETKSIITYRCSNCQSTFEVEDENEQKSEELENV